MNNTAWKLFLIMITFGIKTVHFMPSNRPFSQTDELTNRVPIQLTDLVLALQQMDSTVKIFIFQEKGYVLLNMILLKIDVKSSKLYA